uniref:gliding motility protein GldB-related protein n=1 Tax=Barnesiella intestinihominis TaxID=487174 RepID=UPI003AB28415
IDTSTPFFPVYCRHILGLGDAPSFQKGLKMFLSNEAISQLYADTETKFSNDTVWITELQNAFLRYNELFAPQKRPRILTHISGLNQSIVTIDTTLLSVSLDCYLGENYPLYEQRYYNYERNLHESNRIPIDVVEVWLRTLYPYQSQRNALLDRMIYEGKILYCLSQIFPRTNEYVLLGYSDKQAQWCKENEAEIWKQLIGKKHLFNTESMLINKYIEPAPFVSVLHQDAPGRLGRWIGLQIIKAYANEKKKEAIEIIETTDNGGEILSASKYNG